MMSIDRLLGLFPNTWRSRYEAEVRELLDAHPFTWRERRDLLGACVDAWRREGASWLCAIGRVFGLVGVRLTVLLAVGWIGLQLVHLVAGLEFTRGLVAEGGLWVRAVAALRLPIVLVFQLFVGKPYADSGDPLYRPSWWQTMAITLVFIALTAVDERRGTLPQFADMLIIGCTATMRYARWFVVIDTSRPVPNHGRRVLGLQ